MLKIDKMAEVVKKITETVVPFQATEAKTTHLGW